MSDVNTKSIFALFATCSAAALMLAAPAYADRRKPAPIVYGGQTSAQAVPAYRPQAAPAPRTRSVAPSQRAATEKTRRIEFRYPDQPDTFYGEGRARSAQTNENPIAFSSAKAAIGVNQARQYAAVAPPPAANDPAITRGGFDARAAAAQVAATQKAPEPVRITAASPQAAKPLGRPVTLSRASQRDGATISEEVGLAGAYGDGFDGRATANGERFERTGMTAAHPTLPLPSLVQVVNTQNGREIVVRVNDRGPFAGGRIIDLSDHAAKVLGFGEGSTAPVKVRYLGPAPVMQNPSAASQSVEIESLPAFQQLPPQTVAYQEPNLGVPDPIDAFTPQAPVKKMASATGNIFIQAGSFADIGNAQRLNAALGRGMPVEIQEARVRNADYFRVMIGPFSSRQQAETYRVHLADSGIANGIVVAR